MDFDYRLLAKYLTGMLSPEEMKQVEEWRKLSIDNEEVFSELMKLRVSWKFTQYNTPEHIEEALNGLNAKINSRRRFQILRSVMRYAAVILLFVSFSYVGWGYLKPDNCVTIRVEQGEDVKKIVLAADGINAEIINIHTIKPLDRELVVKSALKTGKVVTVEEHSVIGGLGSAVCDVLCEEAPTKVLKIGINDVFGESGPALELIKKYGLDAEGIYKKVKAFVK